MPESEEDQGMPSAFKTAIILAVLAVAIAIGCVCVCNYIKKTEDDIFKRSRTTGKITTDNRETKISTTTKQAKSN